MPATNHPIVGKVTYTTGGGGRLFLPDAWVSKNIGLVLIPELKGVPTYGGKFSGNVRFYKRAIPQLKAAFSEVGRLGLADKILFWDGSFVPRLKRGGSTPSNHTYATAFDINAQWNGFRVKPAAKGKRGDLHAIAAVFKRYGFIWGGDWERTPDGMHFEIKRILSADEIAAIAKGVEPTVANSATAEHPVKFFLHGIREQELIGAEIKDGKLVARVADVAQALGFDLVKVNDRRKEANRFDVKAAKEDGI